MRTSLIVFAVLLCLGSALAKPAQSGQSCTMCQFIANYAEDFLGSNATETEIINFVASVCTLFPTAFQQQCHNFIAEEGRSLIQLLLSYETPSVICSQLGLCSSMKVIKPAQSGQYCQICEFIMTAVDGWIQQQATVEEIEAALDKLCKLLPGDANKQIVKNYIPLALQWIANNEDPQSFCTQVGLCASDALNKININ